MGYVLAAFSTIFLLVAIVTQTVSFLTSFMYQNQLVESDHEGLFRRCLPIIGCRWWDRVQFNADPGWLQATTIMAITSAGALALATLFALISLIPRFRSRRLNIFIGVILFINAIVLAALVTVYTTLNSKNIKFSGGLWNYSWSYWLLYGGIGSNLFGAIFFCCNQPTRRQN